MKSRAALVRATLLVVLVLAFGIGEGMARLAGVHVFKVQQTAYIGWAKPDPILGWRNNPGTYSADEPPHDLMRFLPDGSRASGTPPGDSGPVALFIGSSWTEGYGLPDDKVFTSLLQKRFPDLRIMNFGVPGYGTYQTLLLLRELIEQKHIHPAAIVYGYLPSDAERNVLTFGMLDAFRAFGGQRFALPHAEMRNGELRYFPPFVVPDWPLEEHSALITLLHQSELHLRLANRDKDEIQVTDLLMRQMKQLATDQKARLLVATLWNGGSPGPEAILRISENMDRAGIEQMDVTYHGTETRKELLNVGGVGHPGVVVQIWWADKIGEWLAHQRL
jgi:hypothetical protein